MGWRELIAADDACRARLAAEAAARAQAANAPRPAAPPPPLTEAATAGRGLVEAGPAAAPDVAEEEERREDAAREAQQLRAEQRVWAAQAQRAAAEQPDAPAAETATRWRKIDLLLATPAAAAPRTGLAAPRFRFGKRSDAELDPTGCATCAAPRAFCASNNCVALLPCTQACGAAAAEEDGAADGYRVNCSICEEPPCAAFCARCFDPPPAREAEAGECQRCFWSGCEGCGGTRFDVFCCNASCAAGRHPGAVRGDCRDCAEEDPRCQDCDAFFGAPGPSSDGEGEYPSHYDGDDHDERNGVSLAVIDKFLQLCQRRRQKEEEEEEAEEEAEAAEIEAIAEAGLDPTLKGGARRRALEQARADLEFDSLANRYY